MMMKRIKIVSALLLAVIILSLSIGVCSDLSVFAADNTEVHSEEAAEEGDAVGSKAIAAGIVVGLAAAAGAIGMGIAIAKSNESIARQPEAASKINSTMMLGLVFIETAIIYALIVAILIIFVL